MKPGDGLGTGEVKVRALSVSLVLLALCALFVGFEPSIEVEAAIVPNSAEAVGSGVHVVRNQEAAGSIPARSTNPLNDLGQKRPEPAEGSGRNGDGGSETIMGVNVRWERMPDLSWRLLDRTIIGMIRTDIPRDVESLEPWQEIAARGRIPFLILPCTLSPTSTEDVEWVRLLAETFPRAWWEVCNEPNVAGIAPETYVAAVRAFAPILRASGGKIAGPGLGGADLGHLDYFSDLIAAGLFASPIPLDWLSLHPYAAAYPEAVGDYYKRFAGIPLPLCVSEWGYREEGLGERGMGEYLRRLVDTQERERVPVTVWFEWQDGPGVGGAFGLLRADGSPRPALFRQLLKTPARPN